MIIPIMGAISEAHCTECLWKARSQVSAQYTVQCAYAYAYYITLRATNKRNEMATLHVGKSLKDTDVLWRYLSLEKFIDLVDSKTLFFSPLAWYEKTDPFEGYVPRVAMDAFAALSNNWREQQILSIRAATNLPEQTRQNLLRAMENAESSIPSMKSLYKNIALTLMVNCWYKSEHESEGMWSLYSRNGLAIKTTVGAIKTALISNTQSHTVHIGAVKYIDFSKNDLKPADCVTEDGHIIGMLKRTAYSHENEVRMYITRERKPLELHEPAPTNLEINVGSLLGAIVISPFADKTTERSIHTICRWSNINESIVSRSNLLNNCEDLLDAYKF
ncbi:DUF2971 domain-containing protein [Uliginosibacterium sediminicola]|uniref:DUF2971 domain-containing protein n=1 Tax=Uliginosibacterium sediminicola TaxID=2024550 RepID=A0ABU9YZI5_9RHOO